MSADATAYVWKHSPMTGAQLLVHLAIADVVNDTYGYEFWMSRRELARKCRTARSTVTETIGDLCKIGLLERLSNGGDNRPSRYRFLMWSESDQGGRTATEGGRTTGEGGSESGHRTKRENQLNSTAASSDFRIPPKEESAPPPWAAEGLTYREWMQRANRESAG